VCKNIFETGWFAEGDNRFYIDSEKIPKVTIEGKGSIFTDSAYHLGQFIERPNWISSVAFWYQRPIKTFS